MDFNTRRRVNLLSQSDWNRMFVTESIDAILAEHVWEHLSYDDSIIAAKRCYQYLKPGGYIRCAVPDKNFRNEWYQNVVKVGGQGPLNHPAASHKMLYDYETLSSVFVKVGFDVSLLEYCDKNGDFHYTYWNENDGLFYDRAHRITTMVKTGFKFPDPYECRINKITTGYGDSETTVWDTDSSFITFNSIIKNKSTPLSYDVLKGSLHIKLYLEDYKYLYIGFIQVFKYNDQVFIYIKDDSYGDFYLVKDEYSSMFM